LTAFSTIFDQILDYTYEFLLVRYVSFVSSFIIYWKQALAISKLLRTPQRIMVSYSGGTCSRHHWNMWQEEIHRRP